LAEFERFKEQAARQLGEQIKLPGFRQGKVPREALERQIGLRAINDEATQLAINAVLRQVITDHNLKPIGAPQAKIEPVVAGLPAGHAYRQAGRHGLPLVFTLTLPVVQVTKLPDYQAIKVSRPAVVTSDADVQKVLQEIRESRVSVSQVDRPGAMGDQLEIDFQTRVSGVKVENGESENHPLILGQKRFLPGFEEALVGLKAGDTKEFEIKAPADYYHPALAGKPVQFKVRVRQVMARALPEVTDDFAKSLGHFKDAGEFKASITAGLKHEREQVALDEARTALLKKISDQTTAEFPTKLTEGELDSMLSDLKNRLAGTGLDWPTYLTRLKKDESALRAEWQPRAAERVKMGLIIEELIDKEAIEVAEADIQARSATYLQHFKSPKDAAKTFSPQALYLRVKHELERAELFKRLDKQIEVA